MRRRDRSTAILLTSTIVCLIVANSLFAASPTLSIITPRGVQRGTESVLVFSGARLADAEEILFYQPGVTVQKIEPNGANRLKVTIKIAPDCRLGEHTAQVRTKTGISDYRTFYVGALPALPEKEPNSLFEEPQAVKLNTTVTGVVTSEDVDYFVVEAKKGQRISAEIEGMRLGTALFDPYVAILDSKRFELSADDDTPLVKQDAVASIVAPQDGKYIIEVRESAYAGNGNCRYRLHLGTFPRPTSVYPAGGKLGEEIEVQFLGDAAGDFKQKFKLPTEPDNEYGLFATDANGISPSANPFRLFEYGNALEKEPNNSVKEATPVELPLAFNGILESDGDVDFFKFQAKKGAVYEVECYARRVRSAIDPVMNLYYANGRRITGNDDSRGPDSYFRFRVPADGEYVVGMADHLGRGGPGYVYRIEFQPVKASLTLQIPRVARYSQSRQTIYVPKGNRFATLMSVTRRNFGGEIALDPKDLPQGIKVVSEPMRSNLNVMPVVFEAAADAPIAGKLVDFQAKHVDPKQKISGGFYNTADFIRGAPGQSIYWRREVHRLAIAVVDEVPFRLEIIEPKVPLVRNGAMNLKIVAHRKEGFTAAINVQFPFRPPGVGTTSSINIPAGKSEITYPLNANANAQLGEWKIYVLGSANVGGTAWVSSQLATIEIAEPYVLFTLERAAVEQGKETELFCKVECKREFAGTAKVRLVGLPNKVTAAELTLTKDMSELVFKIVTDKVSPAGRHRSVFCQVFIPENGEEVIHRRVGATELRIDKPLPPPKTQPKPKPKPKQPVVKKPQPKKKPVVKRLTRLEKLRLEVKKRNEAGQK